MPSRLWFPGLERPGYFHAVTPGLIKEGVIFKICLGRKESLFEDFLSVESKLSTHLCFGRVLDHI